jgi:hypothetical protein
MTTNAVKRILTTDHQRTVNEMEQTVDLNNRLIANIVNGTTTSSNVNQLWRFTPPTLYLPIPDVMVRHTRTPLHLGHPVIVQYY